MTRFAKKRRDMTKDSKRRTKMGVEGYRAWARKDKRLERLRRAHRAGRPYTVTDRIGVDQVAHPQDCPCYDCLYGWVRELRLQATTHNVALLEEGPPARTGRAANRGSKMPGVGHVGA